MDIDRHEFDDIAPYDDSVFHEKLLQLVENPGFLHALSYTMPREDIPTFVQEIKTIRNGHDFQHYIMLPFLEMIAKSTTSGITIGGIKYYNPSMNYVFMTNHRDIVLDASFLNLAFVRKGMPTCEVAIGNNLLIYEWISDLVRLNKSFIVKRDTGIREALNAAKHLSAYIHKSVTEKHQNVWIAQREGRAKDSSDHTQESLVKMLSLGGHGTFMERIEQLNIMPICISYEYDPNDYLKAKEFLLRRRDPGFKKTQRDDLFSMETGLMQFKGRVNFQMTQRINTKMEQIGEFKDRNEAARNVCHIIDQAIHRSYMIFSINYIAFDMLHSSERFRHKYTEEEKKEFEDYLQQQIAKIDVEGITEEERAYLREMMLVMYANPLRNKLRTILGGQY